MQVQKSVLHSGQMDQSYGPLILLYVGLTPQPVQ